MTGAIAAFAFASTSPRVAGLLAWAGASLLLLLLGLLAMAAIMALEDMRAGSRMARATEKYTAIENVDGPWKIWAQKYCAPFPAAAAIVNLALHRECVCVCVCVCQIPSGYPHTKDIIAVMRGGQSGQSGIEGGHSACLPAAFKLYLMGSA